MHALIVDDIQSDYRSNSSALDAMRQGFKVTIDTGLCRSTDMYDSLDLPLSKMKLIKVSVG